MDERCPFCWGRNIREVARVVLDSTDQTKMLHECLACEKWYWKDSGEEVFELAELCCVLKEDPARCAEIILNPIRAGYFRSPKTKIKEFNHICSGCSNKRFEL
jgi:hypothetical protein